MFLNGFVLIKNFCLDLWNYSEELHKLVGNLYQRMSKIQDNLKEIKMVLKVWATQPLFQRKEEKKVNIENIYFTNMMRNHLKDRSSY